MSDRQTDSCGLSASLRVSHHTNSQLEAINLRPWRWRADAKPWAPKPRGELWETVRHIKTPKHAELSFRTPYPNVQHERKVEVSTS